MMMNDKDEQPENGDWKSLEAQIVVMILNDDDDENDTEEDGKGGWQLPQNGDWGGSL